MKHEMNGNTSSMMEEDLNESVNVTDVKNEDEESKLSSGSQSPMASPEASNLSSSGILGKPSLPVAIST